MGLTFLRRHQAAGESVGRRSKQGASPGQSVTPGIAGKRDGNVNAFRSGKRKRRWVHGAEDATGTEGEGCSEDGEGRQTGELFAVTAPCGAAARTSVPTRRLRRAGQARRCHSLCGTVWGTRRAENRLRTTTTKALQGKLKGKRDQK